MLLVTGGYTGPVSVTQCPKTGLRSSEFRTSSQILGRQFGLKLAGQLESFKVLKRFFGTKRREGVKRLHYRKVNLDRTSNGRLLANEHNTIIKEESLI